MSIALLMYPRIPPDDGMAAALLEALEENPVFAPTHWGAGERDRRPYSSHDILEKLAGDPAAFRVFLHRQTAVKYTGYFDFARLPFVTFDFKVPFPKTRWPDLLKLTDRIAAALKPRFGILHIFRAIPDPWITEQDRLLNWITMAAHAIPVRFRANGPLGPGMRTYFGHDVLAAFTPESILSTPAHVQQLDWGGIRVDLADDLWSLDQTELAARWEKAMNHLRPRNVFAEPVFEGDNRTVSFTPSQGWLNRGRTDGDSGAGA